MDIKQIAKDTVDALKNVGFDSAQVRCSQTRKHELYARCGKIGQLMTAVNTTLELTGIVDNKKATMAINDLSDDVRENTIEELMRIAQSSQPDEANDIADNQPAKEFVSGPADPDLDGMYDMLADFISYVKKNLPKVILGQGCSDFTVIDSFIANSNGVEFASRNSQYLNFFVFGAKDGNNCSSFNYTVLKSKAIDGKLIDKGTFKTLLEQIPDQLNLKSLAEDFTGDVIITPDCLLGLLGPYIAYLTDGPMIKGSSVFKGKLNQKIAHDGFTLHSQPLSEELAENYFVTPDGFEAQNSTIIDKGVLKTYLLSLYGANKTGLDRAVNSGGCYVIEPGTIEFEQMVRSVDKGLLLCRFSGGNPSANGDFSGVAKNSYYIENGKIAQPLCETMISGNLVDMFNNIKGISSERVNFGLAIMPWMHVDGVNVSGK